MVASHSVMGSLGVWIACGYDLFIAIAMNICLKARDSSPTRAKNARVGDPASESLDADTSSGSVPKLTHY